MLYFAPIIFFFIALVFAMLGMGGSQLFVPLLYWLGMNFKTQAIPLGMLLNVVTSTSAAIAYSRKKMIDWNVAIPFGLSMIIFAPVGTWANICLPTKAVILVFAIFTAAAAILMLSGKKPEKGHLSSKKKLILGISAGSLLGFFAGLLGRGGGAFVVPLLYIAGLDAKIAAATSSLVVTFSGISSFVSHIVSAAQPDWFLWSLCTISVILGSQAGAKLMAEKLKAKNVKLLFGVVLLIVAGLLFLDVILR